MHRTKNLLLTSVWICLSFTLFAQPKDNSPYSRFGIGDIHEDNFIFAQGMGNLGATLMDPYHLNLVNPASYGQLQATAFELGLDVTYKYLSSPTENASIFKGNVNYFALGLPLINRINDALERTQRNYDVGLTFSLKPHSTVGYNILSTEMHPDEGQIERNYTGDGGSYKFMTGVGARYKDFSFGFNAGYLFGQINYSSQVYFADLPFAYNNNFTESFSLNGFVYNVGLQYSLTLNRAQMKTDETIFPKKLIVGLYGNSKTSFNTSGDVFYGGILTGFNTGGLNTDTLYFQEQVSGKGTLPAKIGGGISYHHGYQWQFGANYETTFWSQYTNEGKLTRDQLLDSYKVSLGADYVPDLQSYTSFYKRMHYRMGLYYQTDGRSENGQQFSEAAINLGLGIPFVFKRKLSNVDLCLSIGQSMGDRLISESFVKFGLGLTFNDQEWFIKRRYY